MPFLQSPLVLLRILVIFLSQPNMSNFVSFQANLVAMLAFQSCNKSCSFVLHARSVLLAQGPEAQLGTSAAALLRLFG